ncbi:S8 family serine peptidase [Flavisolibacter tropicus]|uniref:Peptidase S8/S53 domain-containing protein n=1 Tax=Flavisolibacter tropicus TaxID=1492898 RepID=A0A172U1F8_9BACT|nr:S8 family serine peptidase [Flavisolibacter tropicus]ANE52863.1 hypothetical protein SY85_22660 [Flavisolibacter tropicus]
MNRLLTLTLICLFISLCSNAQLSRQDAGVKVSASLSKKLLSARDTDSIDVYVSYTNADSIQASVRFLSTYQAGRVSLLRTKVSELQQLLKTKHILFADAYVPPKEELTTATLDLATNKINLAHNDFPALNGSGLNVSIKENLLDTTDLDYIGRFFNTGLNAASVTAHATIMATTIAGAGNTSSFGKGVAPNSYLTSSNFASLLPDADAVFKQNGISVQNHSYGTAIQNYYGPEAAAYDISAANNPELLHVFSSGNSGTSKGTENYNDLDGVANLTGNFKMAKSILTVGAIDSFYQVSPLSSKGPAYDGRIKPELVAFGEDGSSGAAAMVSGSALLVQQAYKLKYGRMPLAATTKAILINSADDVGQKGIDFASGFGNLNTHAAIKTVQEGRMFEGSRNANTSAFFQIVVPQKAALLKVTLVWADPAAAVNATKALVNDLDLTVSSPDGIKWLPWVLNSKPNKQSLLSAPERKTDTLNTIEQVSIETPVAGTYTIQVAAKTLQSTSQAFSIAYQIDSAETVFWTFPAATDKLEANATSVIRWQTNISSSGTIEYSTDKTTWKPVASIADIGTGYFKWQVPDITSTAWLRLKTADKTIITDTFVISHIPTMDVGFQCADSFLLLWNKQPVQQFQLYELKDKYLSTFATVTDTFSLLKKTQHPAIYYSVIPIVNGKPGLQASILNYTAQGVNCYFKSFYVQSQTPKTAILSGSLGSVYGVSALVLQKLVNNAFVNNKPIGQLQTKQFVIEDSDMHQGLNQYRLALQLTNGQTIYSEIIGAYQFNGHNVIIYPNPASQGQPIQIITSRAGRTAIKIYNSAGALLSEMRLKDLKQQIPPLRLNTGMYVVKVVDEETGDISSQKIIVY